MTPEMAPLYTRSQELCTWLLERTERFRKSQRFLLGRRLASTAIALHEELALALRFRRGRAERLRRADEEAFRLLVAARLAERARLLSERQVAHLFEQLREIGRMIGGLTKTTASVRREAP